MGNGLTDHGENPFQPNVRPRIRDKSTPRTLCHALYARRHPRAPTGVYSRGFQERRVRGGPTCGKTSQLGDNCWEHIRAVSAVLRRHRPGVGEEVDRNIADTACSSKPLCGPMGIEGVNGAKGGGAGKGKSYELRPWLASGRRKERWRGVAGEVMRCQPKGSGHTAAEATGRPALCSSMGRAVHHHLHEESMDSTAVTGWM